MFPRLGGLPPTLNFLKIPKPNISTTEIPDMPLKILQILGKAAATFYRNDFGFHEKWEVSCCHFQVNSIPLPLIELSL